MQTDVPLYRTMQTLAFLPSAAYVLWHVWWIIAFPRDSHPYVRLSLAALVALVPLSIWIRDITGTPHAHRMTSGVGWITQIAAAAFGMFCAGWTGWLFTGPYSGPMSAEAAFISLVAASTGCIAAILIAAEPFLLDQSRPRPSISGKRSTALIVLLYIFGCAVGLTLGPPIALALGLAA